MVANAAVVVTAGSCLSAGSRALWSELAFVLDTDLFLFKKGCIEVWVEAGAGHKLSALPGVSTVCRSTSRQRRCSYQQEFEALLLRDFILLYGLPRLVWGS